jgi:four helix bundle protein
VKSEVKATKAPDIRERTFRFSVEVVNLCRQHETTASASRVVSNQLLRAATSIGANVEEAYGSQSRADFAAKMSIACKEARETRYWIRLAEACGLFRPTSLGDFDREANEIVAILTTIAKKCRT